MSDYQHILVAVDFSEHGNHVALKAKALAHFYQAKLSLVHVVDTASLVSLNYELELPYTSLDDLLIDTSKKKLNELNHDLQLESEQKWVKMGSSHNEIIKAANENSVDLIVIGSHAHHGLRILLGSTANAILHRAKCDVLAVRLNHD
ncbi:MAG: universal stress protein [Methylococcales bacterium]|nr:universal stress protein [Methylococcales bacterium]